MESDKLYKIVVIGDSGVGKSNLITRYTKDFFTTASKSTIGVEFATKNVDCNGVTVTGQIWDTAGQDRFRAITTAFYRGAHGALICYDISSRSSFEHLDDWFKEIEQTGENKCINVLIGNKADLEDQRQVGTEEGKEFAQKLNIRFLETSAAQNTNVDLAFDALIRDIYEHQSKDLDNDDDTNTRGVQSPLVGGIRIPTETAAPTSTTKSSCC